MIHVTVTGSLENALRLFRSKVKAAGIMDDLKQREYYVKPGKKRRLKADRAMRRRIIEEKRSRNERTG